MIVKCIKCLDVFGKNKIVLDNRIIIDLFRCSDYTDSISCISAYDKATCLWYTLLD